MFRNTLFAKLFFLLLLAVVIIAPGIYYFTIPFVDARIYSIEERAGKTALDTIYSLLKQTKQDLSAWEAYSLASHKRSLKAIVNVAVRGLDGIWLQYEHGQLTYKEAQLKAIEHVSSFRFGNNDYLYIIDYDANLIYHPDPKLNGTNIAALRDVKGKLLLPPLIEKARLNGDAYREYWWHRLGDDQPINKLAYAKNMACWSWVLGSGVYIDDINAEMRMRKEEVISFLREFVRSSKIATTGYLYIFDGDLNMIIHPNSNIENTNFATLKNPITGKAIGEELMNVALNSDNKFTYKWDKLSDPGNYIYDKVAWVRYLPEYDYYVASSVYVDDLQSSGKQLANRMVQVIIATILLLTFVGAGLLFNVTSAIQKLVVVANRIVSGDLSQKAEVTRSDEIGSLSHSFNQMVDKLKEQIDTLEARVDSRTAEQGLLVAQLEQNNIETNMLKDANDMLQECRNEEEIFKAVKIIMYKAFPETTGLLTSLIYEGQRLEVVVSWNCAECVNGQIYGHDACFAMRHSATYVFDDMMSKLLCPHFEGEVRGDASGDASDDDIAQPSICVPITAYGDTFGILHIQHDITNEESLVRMVALVENITEYIANALANLRLKNRLQQQSVRDPLTGLFNRRYMDEMLRQQESRASRVASQVGIIMIDVDHFKNFNDEYGHEAGDEVLKILGKTFLDHFRESDIVCRYGGEEFIVIMPDITLGQCQAKAENLRSVVASNVQIDYQQEILGITISLGVALFPLHGDTMRSVVKLADDALYKAKAAGRNNVVCANEAS